MRITTIIISMNYYNTKLHKKTILFYLYVACKLNKFSRYTKHMEQELNKLLQPDIY